MRVRVGFGADLIEGPGVPLQGFKRVDDDGIAHGADSSEQKAGAVLPRHVSCIAVRRQEGRIGLGTIRTLIRGDAKRPRLQRGETQEPGAFRTVGVCATRA